MSQNLLHRRVAACCVMTLAILFAEEASAATDNWQGTTTLWSNTANWSLGVLPDTVTNTTAAFGTTNVGVVDLGGVTRHLLALTASTSGYVWGNSSGDTLSLNTVTLTATSGSNFFAANLTDEGSNKLTISLSNSTDSMTTNISGNVITNNTTDATSGTANASFNLTGNNISHTIIFSGMNNVIAGGMYVSPGVGADLVTLGGVWSIAKGFVVDTSTVTITGTLTTGTFLEATATTGTITIAAGSTVSVGTDLIVGINGGTSFSVVNVNSALGSLGGGIKVLAGTLNIGTSNPFPSQNSAILLGSSSGTSTSTLSINTGGVSLNNPITVNSGSSGNATISASTTATYGGAITLNKAVNLNSTTASAVIDFTGKISGNGNLTINTASSGIVALDNNTNNFVGSVTVSGGFLRLASDDSALGANANTLNFNGGGLQFNTAAFDLSALSRTVNYLGSSLTVDTNGLNATFANPFGNGTMTLVKSGSGKLTLSGANTFTGGVNLTGGNLQVQGVETPGTSGPLGKGAITFSGGTLQFSSTNTFDYSSRFATASQAIKIDTNGQTVTFASPLPSGGITLNDTNATPGTLILTGANSYTGNTTVNSGTLKIGPGGSIGSGRLTLNGGVVDLNGSDLVVSSPNGTGGTIVNNASGTNHTLTVSGSSGSFPGLIADNTSGTGTIALVVTGGVTLSGADTYTGGTTIGPSGSLGLSGVGSLGSVNSGLFINGGSLAIGIPSLSVGNLTGTGTITNFFLGATLTIGNNDSTGGNFAGNFGVINNTSLTIIKTGLGTMTLSGPINSNGPISVNGGTLVISGPSNASALTTNNNATLRIDGGTINFSLGSLRANSGGAIEYNNATVNAGFLSGPGTHTILGTSTNTSFNGNTVSNGTIIQQNGGATFTNVTNGGSLTNSASLTWDGGENSSTGQLTVNNSVNATAWSNSGVMTINAGGVLNNSESNLVLGGGSRTFVGSQATPGGQIVLAGGVTLEVNGALLVNNGAITGTTNVNFGSVVKGAGTFGVVNVTDGGVFSPGNSPGAAATTGATWGSGGHYQFEINNAAGAPGIGWDVWNVSGPLAITAGQTDNSQFSIDVVSLTLGNAAGLAANFNNSQSYQWQLAHAAGGISGYDTSKIAVNAANFQNSLGGGNLSLYATGNDIYLSFVPAVANQWNLPGSGVWNSMASWSAGTVPDGTSAGARFGDNATSAAVVDLEGGTRTVNQVQFENSHAGYSLQNGRIILAGTTPTISLTEANTQNQAIAANIQLAANLTIANASSATLTLSGQQDWSNHNVTVTQGSVIYNVTVPAVNTAGSVLSIASGATAELAGTLTATSDGTNSVDISNAGILNVTGSNQRAGTISGTGTSNVGTASGNGSLTIAADHSIQQGALNIGNASTPGTATVTITASTPNSYVSQNTTVPSGNSAGTSILTSLSIANDGTGTYYGTLDLQNNNLVINYTGPTPVDDVRKAIQSAYTGGTWTGAGLTSSLMNLDPNQIKFALVYDENSNRGASAFSDSTNLFEGAPVATQSVVVKYSWIDDLNMDGVVNFDDLQLFKNNYLVGAVGHTYSQGELNYDGVITFDDNQIFKNNYQNGGFTQLPEPSSIILASLGLLGLLLARRKRAHSQGVGLLNP